jgi:hypothetical protein
MSNIGHKLRLARFARQLRTDGVTKVEIKLDEINPPAGDGKQRRIMQTRITTDQRTIVLGVSDYPSSLTLEQVRRANDTARQRDGLLCAALEDARYFEARGFKVPYINNVPTEIVRREMEGEAGHGPIERRRC